MADYSPVYMPGSAISATASATITGGQVLVVSGDGTVGPAGDAADVTVIGVAGQDAISGARLIYYGRGMVHETVTAAAVTAGNGVSVGAAGTVDDDAGSDPVIGVFLTSAAAGDDALWMEY